MNRRAFIRHAATAATAACLGQRPTQAGAQAVDLDQFIEDTMRRDHIPGVAACIVRGADVVWSGSYGYADLERHPCNIKCQARHMARAS